MPLLSHTAFLARSDNNNRKAYRDTEDDIDSLNAGFDVGRASHGLATKVSPFGKLYLSQDLTPYYFNFAVTGENNQHVSGTAESENEAIRSKRAEHVSHYLRLGCTFSSDALLWWSDGEFDSP
jgi:hypothetical protein